MNISIVFLVFFLFLFCASPLGDNVPARPAFFPLWLLLSTVAGPCQILSSHVANTCNIICRRPFLRRTTQHVALREATLFGQFSFSWASYRVQGDGRAAGPRMVAIIFGQIAQPIFFFFRE